MALLFHPKPGMVLLCDFEGNRPPEMVKRRPVIVVSPYQLNRKRKCCTVVPLSTVAPDKIEPYQHFIRAGTYDFQDFYRDSWVKADMLQVVSYERLSRLRIRGREQVITLTKSDFIQVRQAIEHALEPIDLI